MVLFQLAEVLGTTVAELSPKLSLSELAEWQAYFKWKKDEQDKQRNKAKRKGRSSI